MTYRAALLLYLAVLLPAKSLGAAEVEATVVVHGRDSFVGRGATINAASGAVSGALRGHTADSGARSSSVHGVKSKEPAPACSCDCCDVTSRRPAEMSFGAGVKCTPGSGHSPDMCSEQCTTSNDDRIMQEELVDMLRYCFFECKPADGPEAKETSQCVAFTSDEATKIINPAGNPIDPAFLYSPVVANSQKPDSFYYGAPVVYNTPAGASANLLSTRTRQATLEVPSVGR